MKTTKNLWDEFASCKNIEAAIKKSLRNAKEGRRKKELRWMFENRDTYIPILLEKIENYKPVHRKPLEIYDGISKKKRKIIVPTAEEVVIHNAVANVLETTLLPSMYEHTCASIPNRGPHREKKHIEKWLRNDVKNTRYCLKYDIRKFYDSISREILKKKLSKKIRDKKFVEFVLKISAVIEGDRGVPLGYPSSPWLANFFLTELDHHIKEKLKAKYFVRFKDDVVILDGNKRKLHKIKKEIEKYLRDELSLEIKDNWQVFKVAYPITKEGKEKIVGRDIDFMGFRFYRHKTILRRNIMFKCCRKAKKIHRKEKPTIRDCKSFMSYIGYIDATDTYKMYTIKIKPYVNIQKMKRRISRHDRRMSKCGNMQSTAQKQQQLT